MNKHKNIEYIVYSNPQSGSFCGYVKLPDNHPYNKLVDKKSYLNLELSTWKIKKLSAKRKGEKFDEPKPKGKRICMHTGYDHINIDCHGGLTFARRIKNKDWPQGFSLGAWIGWDYSHGGDATLFWEDGYKWSAEEIEKECKNVIEQLLTLNKKKP